MAGVSLYDYQKEAVRQMSNGCILCGGVGSGKSRTGLAYFYLQYGGKLDTADYAWMRDPPDLYIITTARKRDTLEWEGELTPFGLSAYPDNRLYSHTVTIDSWNNIGKYKEARDAFFIFDEQRVVGRGAWVKSFLKIARNNRWILLSATPGDTWQDYIPVFIANGFYRNRTEFNSQHVMFARYSKYPKVERYLNTGRLIGLRRRILVEMEYRKPTTSHHLDIFVPYDLSFYKNIGKTRWDPWKDEPIQNAAGLCYAWRKAVNADERRAGALLEILDKHPRAIIFYNFDYELEILRTLGYLDGTELAEWNGHQHQPVPSGERWVYLVQYAAGAEGWNCVETDTIIFYSQSYSYKTMIQAAGRIDRLNTKYLNLYYYHLKSKAAIDLAIARALREKKDFNAGKFVKW